MECHSHSSSSLAVWVDGLELADADWAHVQSEVRAGAASLNDGVAAGDSFEVDGVSVTFTVEA